MSDYFDLIQRRESCRNFDPNRPVEKEKLQRCAEAAWLAYQGGRLARENGTITFVDVPTGRITLETEQGRIRDVRAEPDTMIVRHDALESLDGLGAGDRVFIVSDRFGTPKLIVASAESASSSATQSLVVLLVSGR